MVGQWSIGQLVVVGGGEEEQEHRRRARRRRHRHHPSDRSIDGRWSIHFYSTSQQRT